MIINRMAAAIQKMACRGKNINRQAPAHWRGLREALGAAAFAVLHQGQSVRVEEMIGRLPIFILGGVIFQVSFANQLTTIIRFGIIKGWIGCRDVTKYALTNILNAVHQT
jgi:hypothetical protein